MSTEFPPRTLIVDLAVRFGGASARALGLLSGMPSGLAGLACLEGTAVHDRACELGLEVYPISTSKLDIRMPIRLARLIRDGEFEVVDTQNTQSKFWATLAAQHVDAALVSTLNSWYEAEHQGSLKGRVYQRIETLTTYGTDMFVVVAPDIRDYLIESGVSPDQISLILNAVEIDANAIPADSAWMRKQFNLPENARTIAAVGRLVPAKGYHHLISAFEYLAALYSDLHLVIVGDGELRDSLTAQIERAGLQSRIHLAGFRSPDEVLSIVKAADIFTMPSVTEGTPIALLEAGALGKAIVASRVGGIPDILTHEVNGLLTIPGDAGSVAGALQRLLDDPVLATRLATAAYERVSRDFSRKAQVAATINAYQGALDHRQGILPAAARFQPQS